MSGKQSQPKRVNRMGKQWSWIKGGIALGLVFLLAVVLVKPLGVSTQYVIADGIVWNFFTEGLIEPSADRKSGYSQWK